MVWHNILSRKYVLKMSPSNRKRPDYRLMRTTKTLRRLGGYRNLSEGTLFWRWGSFYITIYKYKEVWKVINDLKKKPWSLNPLIENIIQIATRLNSEFVWTSWQANIFGHLCPSWQLLSLSIEQLKHGCRLVIYKFLCSVYIFKVLEQWDVNSA